MQNLDSFGIFVLELQGGNRKMTGLSRIFGLQSCICGDARMERESVSAMGARQHPQEVGMVKVRPSPVFPKLSSKQRLRTDYRSLPIFLLCQFQIYFLRMLETNFKIKLR